MTYPVSPETTSFLATRKRMLIGGQWLESAAGKSFCVQNPCDEEMIAEVAEGDAADIDKAVRAAHAAFTNPAWRRMSPAERTKLMLRLADLIEAHALELVELDVLSIGKPISQAKAFDGPIAADMIRYNAGWCTKLGGKSSTPLLPDMRGDSGFGPPYHSYSIREPIGVVGIIIPWNAPMVMTAGKLAPALAAGCTVVIKPAEEAPLSTLRIGELIEEAGFPPGVVNIVPGAGAIAGAALVEHPLVRKISFTGSTEVGQEIVRKSAASFKRVTLELGGKSPIIICKDADLDRAIPAAAAAIFVNCGQNCFSGSRLYAHRSVFDKVVAGVADIAKSMTIGPGLDEATELGPLISARQLDRVKSFFSPQALGGMEVVTGGRACERRGHFFEPTVVAGDQQASSIFREEIFGPVLAAAPFESPEDALLLANDSEYGLAAGLFTNDLSLAHRIAAEVQAGAIWINAYPVPDLNLPFGGFKHSGVGRENGEFGVESYTEMKSVTIAL